MIETEKMQQYQLFQLLKKVSLFLMELLFDYLFLLFAQKSDEYSNSFHVVPATRWQILLLFQLQIVKKLVYKPQEH